MVGGGELYFVSLAVVGEMCLQDGEATSFSNLECMKPWWNH